MRVVRTVAEMRAAVKELRARGRTVGLVPTMGALHAGHMSLVRASQGACGATVVSIFVNPTQFGPGEDLERYPRTFAEDCRMLEGAGVDAVFAPAVEEMYRPGGVGVYVEVPGIGERMDGRTRPGHFRGVATVVTKLLNIVTPDVAYFGQKDAAQVAVLRAMVRELEIGVRVEVCATVREEDGLAMSSRNRYLRAEERTRAKALSRGLRAVERAVADGERDAEALRAMLRREVESGGGVAVEYAEVVDAETLEPLSDVSGGALVAVAAKVGGTRLIDNVVLPEVRA